MLIGVDDDKSIPGVKFPEEESIEIHAALKKFCWPGLPFHESIIPISEKRFVLQWRISKSDKRPHFLVMDGTRCAFVRNNDQCIKASAEMYEILRRSKSQKGTRCLKINATEKGDLFSRV